MNKKIIPSLLIASGMAFGINNAQADEGRGFYIGGFAGAGRSDNQSIDQSAVAFKYAAPYTLDDPYNLNVYQKGNAAKDTVGLGGLHAGYEFSNFGTSNIKPALELEAFYLGSSLDANLSNPNTEEAIWTTTVNGHTAGDVSEHHSLDAGTHTFANTGNMGLGLFLVNGILSYDTGTMLKPYVGGGIGFAYVNVTNAVSAQTGPGGLEHEIGGGAVINHFNSKTNASDYAFAGQFKLGLRAEIDKHWSAFAEYKYVYVDSTSFTFGNTNYPGTHAPTTNWQVNNDSMSFNTGAAGIEYSF